MSDNPSAFPHDLLRDDDAYPTHDASPGMTLRDYFAGQALAPLITDRDWPGISDDDKPAAWAAASYIVADAMLTARLAPTPTASKQEG